MKLLRLTHSVALRLLREGLLLRSLAFPALVVVTVLLATALVVGGTTGPVEVGVTGEVPALPFPTVSVVDPAAAVEAGEVPLATDGRTLWRVRGSTEALQVEAALREHRGAGWVPDPLLSRPTPTDTAPLAAWMARAIGMIYALYGVVVGTGLVVRDRDDGSLAAERTLPVPGWWHAVSRWLGGTVVLALGWSASLALLGAVMTVPHALTMWAHGLAAASACTALGLLGSLQSQRAFSSTLAGGLTAAFVLFGLGAAVPGLPLPVASLAGGGSAPLALVGTAVLAGLLALRARRTWG